LGTLGGTFAIGNGVNSSGQVTGYSTDTSGHYRAFVSSGGALIDIGDLGGGTAVAYAINDLGQVVGSSQLLSGDNRPFLYINGRMTDLGTLGSHGSQFWNTAQAVNNSAQVVGWSYNANGDFLAFVWNKGKMRSLGTLGGDWSEAWGINDNGLITGLAYTAANLGAHAFLSKKGAAMSDLGTLGGSYSTGFAVNRTGVIVGESTYTGGGNNMHAFIYRNGRMKDLNRLVVPNSGWVFSTARNINDSGQIVGSGIHAGQQHGFLLTPQ
jgi:probable HAF family extracellular repeat protein